MAVFLCLQHFFQAYMILELLLTIILSIITVMLTWLVMQHIQTRRFLNQHHDELLQFIRQQTDIHFQQIETGTSRYDQAQLKRECRSSLNQDND